MTQAFFARLLEKHSLRVADPERGKFRSFLLASINNFLANERDRAAAKKRGGDRVQLSIDLAEGESRVNLEPAHELTPERVYERQWALTLLELVVGRMKAEYQAARNARQFELLKDALGGARERLPYADVAAELGINTPDKLLIGCENDIAPFCEKKLPGPLMIRAEWTRNWMNCSRRWKFDFFLSRL